MVQEQPGTKRGEPADRTESSGAEAGWFVNQQESDESERLQILRLLQAGKITVEEADQLLAAIGQGRTTGPATSDAPAPELGEAGQSAAGGNGSGGSGSGWSSGSSRWEETPPRTSEPVTPLIDDWAERLTRWAQEFAERMGDIGTAIGDRMGRWGEAFGQRWGGAGERAGEEPAGGEFPGVLPWRRKEGRWADSARVERWAQEQRAGDCPAIRVDVSNDNGSIQVIPVSGDEYKVELTFRPGDRWRFDAPPVEVQWHADEQGLYLQVETRRNGSVAIRLYLPTGWQYSLRARSMNGSISAEGLLLAQGELSTMNGSVSMNACEARQVSANTMNGSVRMEKVLAVTLEAKTMNGRAEVVDAWFTSGHLSTMNGSVGLSLGQEQILQASVQDPARAALRLHWGIGRGEGEGPRCSIDTQNGSAVVSFPASVLYSRRWRVRGRSGAGTVHMALPHAQILSTRRNGRAQEIIAEVGGEGTTPDQGAGAGPATVTAGTDAAAVQARQGEVSVESQNGSVSIGLVGTSF